MKKPVLGRGLSALLPQNQPAERQFITQEESSYSKVTDFPVKINDDIAVDPVLVSESDRKIINLSVHDINPNPYQPRNSFDNEKLSELVESIKSHGIIQPIVVRKMAGRYEIVSGERRWRAAKLAGLDSIDVILKSHVDDKTMLEQAIVENIQRDDLNSIEIADAIQQLQSKFGHNQDEIGQLLGKNRSTVSNYLRLLTLPDDVRQMLIERKLEMGHAKAILSIQSPSQQIKLANKIVSQSMSVRLAEKYANKINTDKSTESDSNSDSFDGDGHLQTTINELSSLLGSSVESKLVSNNGNINGYLKIKIHSKDDLDRILWVARGTKPGSARII